MSSSHKRIVFVFFDECDCFFDVVEFINDQMSARTAYCPFDEE